MSNSKARLFGCVCLVLLVGVRLWPAERTIARFAFGSSELTLRRVARPQTPFDKVGRKFAILGTESGTFEAWAYPLKLVRDFELSFFIGSSSRPIPARDIVRFIEVSPAVTTLTYVFQSFTVKASFVAAVSDPGAVVLLSVDAVEPLTIVCSFLPVLQPMWPAGIGGQYAAWDDELKAYLISEPRRRNHGFIGSPAAEGISYTPAHMLSDTPNEFKISVPDPKSVRDKFLPIILAGGEGDRETVKAVYRRLEADPRAVYLQAEGHFRGLRDGTLRIATPDPDLDLAFEWAKVAFDNLLVDNPDLGLGFVAGLGPSGTSGRPGFGWFFGGDAFINALSLDAYGAWDVAKAAFEFLERRQRPDGKMMHELSQAARYVDWFKDYPYGYIHADTTPYYIMAVSDHVLWSGDVGFLKKSWMSLRKAFDYCLSTDANGDGLMDNSRAGLGALEFGSLTEIDTDVYLSAIWVEACRAMERLAAVVGDRAFQDKAGRASVKARQSFEAKFWDEASGQYSYAFDAAGRRVQETTPWSAVPLVWGLGTKDHARRTLERLNRSDMTTDWGIRMMSSSSSYYEPLNYNYGACWPFLAGYVAAALYGDNQALQGFALLKATARHTFDNALGCITELFSGHQNIWPQEAVPHQGFSSAGVTLPLIRGLLGLGGDALTKEIEFSPRFPGDWPTVSIKNFRIGSQRLSLDIKRTADRLTLSLAASEGSGWTMTFRPLLAGCRGLGRVRRNGSEVQASWSRGAYPLQAEVCFPVSGADTIEMELLPAVDWLVPDNNSMTGESSRGLKIISVRKEGERLIAEVEGLAGCVYDMPLINPSLAGSVEGAELLSGRVRVTFPAGPAGVFVRREVSIIEK